VTWLVACEYSGTVRDALIAEGIDAVSCDLLPTARRIETHDAKTTTYGTMKMVQD